MEVPFKQAETEGMENYIKYLIEHHPPGKKSVVTKQINMTRYFRGNTHLTRKVLDRMQALGMASRFNDTAMGSLYEFDLDRIRKYVSDQKGKE